MPVLLKPYLGCNLKCKYCYEEDYRHSHDIKQDYNIDKMFESVDLIKRKRSIILHGGEPLCLPIEDVEKILSEIFNRIGRSSIQTNATLITDKHIELFKKYKTSVGISIDGDSGLSSFRFGLDTEKKVLNTMDILRANGISTSFITVVSESNASTDEQLLQLETWLYDIYKKGITGRVNPCVGLGQLPIKRMVEVYTRLTKFYLLNGFAVSPVNDLASKINGGTGVCMFSGCDIYSTQAATVILGDGTITNCMKTNHEDVYIRDTRSNKIRDKILKQTPQENGGCSGCEYWDYCNGGCPSTGIDGDWRNRTEICEVWKAIIKVLLKARSVTNFTFKDNDCEHEDSHEDEPHIDHVDGAVNG